MIAKVVDVATERGVMWALLQPAVVAWVWVRWEVLGQGGDLEGINFQKVREDKNPEGIRFTPEFQAVTVFGSGSCSLRALEILETSVLERKKKKKKAQYFIFFHLSEFKNKHFEVKGL